MSEQKQNEKSQRTVVSPPLACPFCGQDKVVRCGVRKTRSGTFYYYSFDPSPDLIGLPSPVAPQASMPPLRAVHPAVRPEGKRPEEDSCGLSQRAPKLRQRWAAPRGFIPDKGATQGGNAR